MSINHKQLFKTNKIIYIRWHIKRYSALTPHNSSMLENWRADIYSNVWKIIKWKVAQNKDMKLLRPFSDATHTGIQFAFTSSWVKQASEKKKKTKFTTVWRVATRHQWKTNVCETLTNGVKAGAWSVRDRRAIGGRGVRGCWWACGGSQQCRCKLAELRVRNWAKGRSL